MTNEMDHRELRRLHLNEYPGSQIPDDVMRLAESVFRALQFNVESGTPDDAGNDIDLIARAIHAERERCAAIARDWSSPLRPGSDERQHGQNEARAAIAAAITPPPPAHRQAQ